MKKPPSQTMTLGHPIVAIPVTLAFGGCGIACLHGGAIVPAALFGAMVAGTVRAAERRSAFLTWRREWDAMAEPGPRRGISGRTWALSAAILIGILMFASADHHTQAGLVGLAVLLGLAAAAIVGLYWLWWRLRAARARRGEAPVGVIAKPGLAVPTLAQAYAALPGYCRGIFSSRPRGQ